MSGIGQNLRLLARLKELTDRLTTLEERTEAYHALLQLEFVIEQPTPISMRLCCEACGKLHIDEGEFRTKVHHTHTCQYCGLTWRPAKEATVGVQWIPGFKNAATPDLAQSDPMRRQQNDSPQSEGLGSQLGKPSETDPSPKLRPIIVDSLWQMGSVWTGSVTQIFEAIEGIRPRIISCSPDGPATYHWHEALFRESFTWLRDP